MRTPRTREEREQLSVRLAHALGGLGWLAAVTCLLSLLWIEMDCDYECQEKYGPTCQGSTVGWEHCVCLPELKRVRFTKREHLPR